MNNSPIIKWEHMLKNEELQKLQEMLPENINTYYDPFCGNLGFTLYVLRQDLAKELQVSDNCKELIDLYFIITYKLDDFLKSYDVVTDKKVDFYKVRKRFNETENIIEKSLTFFMLNKMVSGILTLKDGKCIQGRGRHMVNWKLTREKLVKTNEELKNKKLLMYQKHFTNVIDVNEIKKDDFIYFDINYTLSSEELKQLRDICEKVECKWIIKVNSCLSKEDVLFLKEDYYHTDNFVMNFISH